MCIKIIKVYQTQRMHIYKKNIWKLIQIFYTLTTGTSDAQLTPFF